MQSRAFGMRARAVLGILAGLSFLGSAPTGAQLASTEADELRAGLERLVVTPSWRNAEWGVLVVSLDHGDTLYAVNPHAPLAPASNIKLLTTAAALEALGPNFRFLTYVMTDGVVEDGVLHGDLILYGTGDPGLSSRFHARRDEVFHELIDQLEAAGIREVRGDLVADASFLPGPLRPEGWDPRDLNDHFTAPVSALSFNENVVSMRIVPAERAGQPPSVHTIPDHAALRVVNLAQTVSGRASRVALLRDDPMEPIRVEGTIGVGSSDVWRQFTVSEPATFTASVFRATLEARGISLLGTVRTVDRPGKSSLRRMSAPFAGKRGTRVLARHSSQPLLAYLEVINKQSHNLYAESVFRTLGRLLGGSGSPATSARVVQQSLATMGVDTAGMVLLDGSGLSAGNRVSAGMLVELLGRMSTGPRWSTFWETLPEAGKPRELARMYRTPAAGNLRAKTGTIERVSALSGVVRAADGERLAFSILLNQAPSVARAKAVENQIGARLASFQRGLGAVTTEVVADAGSADQIDFDGAARHRIGPGENLTVIARRYGVPLADLMSANPNVDANRIFAGQWLVIPREGDEVGGG